MQDSRTLWLNGRALVIILSGSSPASAMLNFFFWDCLPRNWWMKDYPQNSSGLKNDHTTIFKYGENLTMGWYAYGWPADTSLGQVRAANSVKAAEKNPQGFSHLISSRLFSHSYSPLVSVPLVFWIDKGAPDLLWLVQLMLPGSQRSHSWQQLSFPVWYS